MWDVGRKYGRSVGDVSDSRRQRGGSERRQRKVRRRGRTFFRKNVEISNKNIRKNSLHQRESKGIMCLHHFKFISIKSIFAGTVVPISDRMLFHGLSDYKRKERV